MPQASWSVNKEGFPHGTHTLRSGHPQYGAHLPQRAAFRWYDEASGTVCTRTYAQYAQDIRRAVRCFAQSIPEIQGKRVCILSHNCYEYGVNALGVMLAGGVLAPLEPACRLGELQAQLELAQPAAILSDGVDYGCAEQLQAAYGSLLRPMDGYTAFDPTDLDPTASTRTVC